MLFTTAAFIGMDITPPWFYAPLPGAVIWTLIDEILDGFVDCMVNGQMGGPTAVLNS